MGVPTKKPIAISNFIAKKENLYSYTSGHAVYHSVLLQCQDRNHSQNYKK
jgi:hypothetical protein